MKHYIFFFASVFLCLTGCTNENHSGPGIDPDEREVEMSFVVPGTTTRQAGDPESAVRDLTLLLFKGSGAEAEFQYSRNAWKTTTGTNSFKTTLKLGEDLMICFAVNARTLLAGLEDDVLVEGTTWAEISDRLLMHTPSGIAPENGLPMWGLRTGQTISENPSSHLGTVQLLRSVASVDAYVTDNNFTLQEGIVAFAADRGYLAFDPGRIATADNKMSATSPYCPPAMKTTVDLSHVVATGESSVANVFYMYENDSPLQPVSPDKRPTRIILKGIWNGAGGSGQPTWYPLSIRDKDISTGEYVKKQVTRNNKYSILVTRVNGDGFGSLEEAKDADDVNVDYEVIGWNDNEDGEIIIDGPKYFYRQASHVQLARAEGSTREVVFRTNYDPDQIKMKFESGVESTNGTIDTHNRFKVEVVTVTEGSSSYTCFRFTAKQEYGTTDNPDTLRVTVGRISFTIQVEQVNSSPDDWNHGGDYEGDLG